MISFSSLLHFGQFRWLSEVLGFGISLRNFRVICHHHFLSWNSKDTSLDLLSNLQVSFEREDLKMSAYFIYLFIFLISLHCIFLSDTMFLVLHDLLKTVQNVQYNLTFLSFLSILGHIKSRPMKRHVISYIFDIYIFPRLPSSLTDEMHLYNLITMPKNIRSKFLPLRLCLLCLAVSKMFMS